MKSQALQSMIQKIFSDEKAKEEFVSNPEGVMSRYSLSESEKKAVMSTYSRIGIGTGNSTQLASAINPTGTWF
jgi:hypothetical protein